MKKTTRQHLVGLGTPSPRLKIDRIGIQLCLFRSGSWWVISLFTRLNFGNCMFRVLRRAMAYLLSSSSAINLCACPNLPASRDDLGSFNSAHCLACAGHFTTKIHQNIAKNIRCDQEENVKASPVQSVG